MCYVTQHEYILVAVKFSFQLAEIFESIFHSAEEIWNNFKMDDYTTLAMVFLFQQLFDNSYSCFLLKYYLFILHKR